MFERFTDQGRRVLVMAQEEARRLNHNYIGTEHLLLGLHREGDGVAVQVLVLLGADLNRLRQQVIQLLGAAQSPLLGAGQSPDVAGADADPARTRIDALDRRLAALEH